MYTIFSYIGFSSFSDLQGPVSMGSQKFNCPTCNDIGQPEHNRYLSQYLNDVNELVKFDSVWSSGVVCEEIPITPGTASDGLH